MTNVKKAIWPLGILVGFFILMGVISQFVNTSMSSLIVRIIFSLLLLLPLVSMIYSGKGIHFKESGASLVMVVSIVIFLILLFIFNLTRWNG